jgi:maleylacetate reductase
LSFFREEFTARSAAVRVRFGAGVRKSIAEELEALGAERALILTTPQQAELGEAFSEYCGDRAVGAYTNATMHTPVDVSDEAARRAEELGADVLVAVGGGSTIGLGKAIALRTGLPQIAVPTTYAGSGRRGAARFPR